MLSEWAAVLKQSEIVLLDYPAYFETGRTSLFSDIIECICDKKSTLVTCSSYLQYETCVRNTYIPNGRMSDIHFPDSRSYFEQLDEAGVERIIEPEMSMYDVILRYVGHKNTCLLTGIHSPLLSQIRSGSLTSEMKILVFDNDLTSVYQDTTDYLNRYVQPAVNDIAAATDYLDVAIYVNVGDKVYTSDGRPVVLAEKINTGAEGLVFKTNDSAIVAKVYHRGMMTPLRWMKLTRMTKLGLKAKGICWPIDLLYNTNHEPVGFTMPRAEGCTLGSAFDGQDAMLDRFPDWNRTSVVQTAQQLLEKMIYLHLCGILIGDIQLKNAMVKSPEQVFLIDMDSVQLEDLPCPVGTEEFTPPELWDKSFQSFLRDQLHEDYSCGILTFALLFCGQHPYNQRLGHETLREEIASLSFPYDLSDQNNSAVPLGGYEMIWKAMPDHLRKMIHKAFAKGQRFETIVWHYALSSYLEELQREQYQDSQYYSLFPYTNRKISEPQKPSGIKRSIMDAIIHVPDQEGNQAASSREKEPIIYNGKPIGPAFINQERLTDLDLKRHTGYTGSLEINTKSDSEAHENDEGKQAVKEDFVEKPYHRRKYSSRNSFFGLTRLSVILIIIILLISISMILFFSLYR